MGPGPPWSPEAPPKSVQCTLCSPSYQAPAGVAAGGLAWARTSGGVGFCDLRPCASTPRRVMQLHSCPRSGGGGVRVPPSSLEGLASAYRRLRVTLGLLS